MNSSEFKSLKTLIIILVLCSSVAQTFGVKIDCHPIPVATKESCEALGCIWSPVKINEKNIIKSHGFEIKSIVHERVEKSRVDEPWCYYPDDYQGYRVYESERSGKPIKLKRIRPSGLPNDIENLNIQISASKKVLRIKIYDANNTRFEPELPVINLSESENLDAEVSYQFNNDSGRLIVRRTLDGVNIFDTDLTKLIFSDKFIQFNTKLDSPFLYGLGEHYSSFLKKASDTYKTYSFWNTDVLPLPDGYRSYGGFPFYVNLDTNNTKANGLYLRNSNAMDIVLQADQSVTFRPIGGIIDIMIFVGPSANEVIAQYQQVVGLPQLPPRWALGFHLCRFNYESLEKTKLVWKRTRDSGIPYDVQWNDVDYMDRHNDFTYDHHRFAGLPEFVEDLHNSNMHYVVIIDPGISQEHDYYPYKLGNDMDIFIKNSTNQTLVGKVWNDSGRTVFPDFSNSNSIDYWKQLFVKFQKELKFDGAWIDMNDISSFVDGSLYGCPDNDLERPIYLPGASKLQKHSLCLSAKHRAGNEYDVHNLYSFYETIATSEAMKAARPTKRPLIISRSSSPGQGHYGGHWSGDVRSNWDYLKWSIPSAIEHSMYGFSLIGSDICGFAGNTSPQLCARWSTLGAFYTFSRNHNDDTSIDQDPVALGPEVVEANRNAFNMKYHLLPYLYSLLYRAHKFGEPALRSVPLEFYTTDPEALEVEHQLLWGRGLMISPIVDENTYEKKTYLPKGRWYESDILPGKDKKSVKVPKLINSTGEWYTMKNISLTNLPLYYRGGYILPIYANPKQTIAQTVAQSFGLQISLCQNNQAHGELYLDDGESLGARYSKLTMEMKDNKLTITIDVDDYSKSIDFGTVKVFGVSSAIQHIKVNGKLIEFKQIDHVVDFDLSGSPVEKGKDIGVDFIW